MTLYRRDVLVARPAASTAAPTVGSLGSLLDGGAPADPHAEAAKIDSANALLEDEGLGTHALLTGGRIPVGDLTVIPTSIDAAVVRDTLKRLKQRGEDVDVYGLDYQSVPGTAGDEVRRGNLDFYLAAGCKTGHGTAAWLPAPGYKMPKAQDWVPPTHGRRPVIALLDTGVEEHERLPDAEGADAFVIEPWQTSERIGHDESGVYYGHGTFNAGIIRLAAPAARILSMRVMSDDGRVDDTKLIQALKELKRLRAAGEPVDVVCMPFGRYQDDGEDDDLVAVKDALMGLTNVPIVASAGNDGLEKPMYPAAFGAEPFMPASIIGVGSSESPTERAEYSNFGVWVKEWRGGTNMVSLMPMPGEDPNEVPRDGFAWWSGTSFSAVRYAAEVAANLVLS